MLAQAVVIGRNHRLMNQNCQDFAVTGAPEPGYAYGIVLDGCGGKYREKSESYGRPSTYPSQNEVGARILGQFMAQWFENNLGQPSLVCLAKKLGLTVELFIRDFMVIMGHRHPEEQRRFAHTNLLATIVGFAVTPTEGCFFWAGDGYLKLREEITPLDFNNQPPYLAYTALMNGDKSNGQFNNGRSKIESWVFPMTDDVTSLAVATDGWQPNQLAQVERPHDSLSLQRWVNVEARQRGRFEDDGAIVLWVNDNDLK
jgi:hypothetical protein